MITLDVQELTKSFGSKTIFTNISFRLNRGVIGISGSNGAGKSTLLKCLGKLLRPSGGQIRWKQEEELLSLEDLQSKMGYAAPYINLYSELSCIENIDFLSDLRHQSIEKSRQHQWLQKLSLAHVAHHPYGKLSSGQQQRLRLASALWHQPDVLLLDEPGTNLDEQGHALVRDLVNDFRQAQKLVILASNNPDELALCDQTYSVEHEAFI